jgi:PAS domain S-box-containing protein
MDNTQKNAESNSDIASRLKAILESAVDGIITIDERGCIEFANPATCKTFGYEIDEMIGRNIAMLMPSPYKENHDTYIHNYVDSGIRKIIGIGREVQGTKKDGTIFPFWLSVSEVKLENKRLFTGVVHDLTEQKKAEEALSTLNKELEARVVERTDKLTDALNSIVQTNQQLQAINLQLQHEIQERKAVEQALLISREELKNTQELLQQIVSNYPDGSISVVDKDFNYIFTGGEILNTLGLNPKEIIGKRLFPLVSEESWQILKKDLEKVFEGYILQNHEFPETVQDFQFAADAFPLKEGDGPINRIAVFTHDVTDLKKVEAELREALKKERELGELKSRFVSMASHEFRTPLTSILSSASLMSQYILTEQQEKREKHFQKIKSSVAQLSGILNDFLSLSRLEEGRVELQWEDLDFNQFCAEMAEEMVPVLKQGQHIFVRHSHESMIFKTDKKLLKMILTNLLSNASKYSDEGAEIHCIIKKEANKLKIDIIDEGIGIPDADKQHMFDRFFRASNAVNIKGTGLGLNIVKRYVELMNGKLTFTSELGKGSTFTIVFPMES